VISPMPAGGATGAPSTPWSQVPVVPGGIQKFVWHVRGVDC
jgi:hypothetical protein